MTEFGPSEMIRQAVAMRMTQQATITGIGPMRRSIRPPSTQNTAPEMAARMPKMPISWIDQSSTPSA